MKIGITGAGNIGSILVRHYRQFQHTVLIANSRGPATLSRISQETGAIPIPVSEAANGADLLVLTIPLKGVPSLPKDLLAHLPATAPIIDTGNYYPARDGQIR
jgi:predicted dinucleotide-binding enzyme